MKSTNRIGLLLGIVFLLPALFFSVYEMSALNKDEKMIQQIYEKQLDAILFSINQYSDDVLSSWITKVEAAKEATTDEAFQKLLSLNPSLNRIFVIDTIQDNPVIRFASLDPTTDGWEDKIQKAFDSNPEIIQQLIEFKKSGFQKTISLNYNWGNPLFHCIIYISQTLKGYQVVGLIIDSEAFIQDLVGPRLQMVAKDQFVLSVFKKPTPQPLYSTLQGDTTSIQKESLTKTFWIFPEHELGIRTVGSSLQKIIDERTYTNLSLLIVLDLILIIAVILVFRNVKREVQLAQNKADFVSNVSHEIRTPLALISMFAETLEMDRVKSEEKKKEYYSIISKETQRLSGIVNKILNFSQTEAKKKILHPEAMDLKTATEDVLKTYDFHLRNKGFVYELKNSDSLWVIADREAFMEAFINLIDNAIKYSADQKRLEISLMVEKEFGLLIVKDFGIGISQQDQKHVFDKFYRVSSGNLAKTSGTGLGLSLVKQLMDAQHGKITVESELGKGSCFTLYFPLQKITTTHG